MSDGINRRGFLQRTAAAGIGLSLSTMLRAQTPPAAGRRGSANNTIRVAVVGTNSRGGAHIECLGGLPGVEIAAICDVDERAVASGIKAAAARQSKSPVGARDIRKLLEDKSIDAVTIATPDHWHAPMAILALAAGKHVYLEKPCSHNPHEGELLIQAVKKSGRVYQMGNQRRSFPNVQKAIQEIRDGAIGKAYFAKAWYDNRRASIGRGKAAPVPSWLDWELWQGPAPRRPFKDNVVHYNWHWFWNWGTGEALNNGTHEVDVCRWALGVNWPARVASNGGRYQFEDDWETPDTQVIGWDFPEGKTISWEGRSCNDFPIEGLGRGAMIYGTEGTMLIDSNNYTLFDAKKKKVKEIKEGAKEEAANTVSATGIDLDRLHFQDFLAAIRTGKTPNSRVEEGHVSVTLLHLGNIAWRAGRSLRCDVKTGHILQDREAMKLWRRDYQPGWEPKV